MSKEKSSLTLGKASLRFLLIAIAIIALSLLLAWIIILVHGSFTYWAIIPFLVGFPVTILINLRLAKKTIANIQNDSREGDSHDEEPE